MNGCNTERRADQELTDLAIIGGGPAGTAAALAARRRGLNVEVWERDCFPRDKVCGEFLSWESLPLLQQAIPSVLARAAVIRRSEFVSRRNRVYAFPLPHESRGLSRRLLDESLWRAAAAAGARTHEGLGVRSARKIDRLPSTETGWRIEAAGRGARLARSLLVACGRWWALDGFPSPARNGEARGVNHWIGAKAHFGGVVPRDAVEMYFFPGGYCGLSPVEDGLYNACCLVHCSLLRNRGGSRFADFPGWLKITARHDSLNMRLRGATQVSETLTTSPVRPIQRRSSYESALLAGDAAGFLDPFTGDGISMALHTGRVAASLIAETLLAPDTMDGASAERRTRAYKRRVRAVRKSFQIAGLLRILVRAPDLVQDSAAILLSHLAPQLLATTRWRDDQQGRLSGAHPAWE